MKKVRLLRDEIVNWTFGPIRLLAGEEPELPDAVAESLVGRGIAQAIEPEVLKPPFAMPVEAAPLAEPDPGRTPQWADPAADVEPDEEPLEARTRAELMALAEARGLTVRTNISKAQLIEVLRGQ